MTRAVDDHQRRYRRRILGVGAGLFVLTFLISAPFLVSGVEQDLEDRVGDELDRAGFDAVEVRFSGQDGTISCGDPLPTPTPTPTPSQTWPVTSGVFGPSSSTRPVPVRSTRLATMRTTP